MAEIIKIKEGMIMKLAVIQIICGVLITFISIYMQLSVIGLSLSDTAPIKVIDNASTILPAKHVIAYFLNILIIILGLVVTVSGIIQLKRNQRTK
jgi:hypothetical protein